MVPRWPELFERRGQLRVEPGAAHGDGTLPGADCRRGDVRPNRPAWRDRALASTPASETCSYAVLTYS